MFRLDGRELPTPGTLFAVFTRARGLSASWASWAREQGTAVVIDHADGLLGVDFLGTFVSVLCQAVSAGMDVEVSLDAGRLMATLVEDDCPMCGSGELD